MKINFLIKKIIVFCFLTTVVLLVGCNKSVKKTNFTIAIDPSWYPLALDYKESYLYRFVDELFQEISKNSSLNIVQVNMNWDNLYQGMELKRYSAIVTSLPKNLETERQYDFTDNFLKTGSILVSLKGSKIKKISDLREGYGGCIQFTPEDIYLQMQTNILPIYYSSIVQVLQGLVAQDVDIALTQVIPTVSYIKDLFSDSLEIVSEPIGEDGLRVISMKGQYKKEIKELDRAIKEFKETKKYNELMKKWRMSL